MTHDDDLLALAYAVGVADAPPAPWSWGDTLGVIVGIVGGYILLTGTPILLGGAPA